MFTKTLRLLGGLLCSYLAVAWLAVELPFYSIEIFAGFILRPLEFLCGIVALIMGGYALGGLIRNGAVAVINRIKGRDGCISDIIFGSGSIGGYFFLLPHGVWQTNVFYCLSILYGMISLSPSTQENE